MGTALVNPAANPSPMPAQDQFIDPATGHLTYAGWWAIHSLRNGTQTALAGTVATVMPQPGGADNSVVINAAILAVIAVGGGALQFVAGNYSIAGPLVFPAGFNGILILGNGATIVRAADMPVSQGVFDIQGARMVTVQNLTIEGSTTVPQRINYATFAGDPMYAAFTLNTSVWMHAGSEDIKFDGVTIQHTGGYAAISDTRVGPDNRRIKFTRCNLWNNRPFLFGTNNADLNYGAWPGGIFYKGDCSSAVNTGVTEDLLVTDCSFERNTGNCVWGHNAGFFNYHRNVRVVDNGFLDCGLDAIEMSCTVGGCVMGNTGQRIGYVTIDDTSRSVPKYLPNLNATFLDCSGYVEGVPFIGNSCSSVCGGFSAADGYCFGAITGNDFRQPQPGDVFYTDDQIALVPAGVVYGFTLNNSQRNQGGDGVTLAGNSLYGCTAGSILALAFRNGKIADNDIRQPGDSTFSPILLGNLGASSVERSYGNSITGNRIAWSPAVPSPAIIESVNWSGSPIPWVGGDLNWIEGNHVFDPLNNAFEFQRAATSGSTTRRRVSSEAPALSNPDWGDIVRMSDAGGANGYTSLLAKDGSEVLRVADTGIADLRGIAFAAFRLFAGAVLEATWSAGSTAAFDVLTAAGLHAFAVLQTGVAQLRGATFGALELYAAAVRKATWSAGATASFDVFDAAGQHVFTITQTTGDATLLGTLNAGGLQIAGAPVATQAYVASAIAAAIAPLASHGTYPVTGGGGGNVTI